MEAGRLSVFFGTGMVASSSLVAHPRALQERHRERLVSRPTAGVERKDEPVASRSTAVTTGRERRRQKSTVRDAVSSQGFAEQGCAADRLQRPLRSRFRQRLSCCIRRQQCQ
jgi:hypothetical protein